MSKHNINARILVAEDDPEIRSMLVLRLQQSGYEMIEAEDGDQALQLIRGEKPDLVLLDIMMPFKSGWEVAKEVRQDRRFDHVGIIVLTAIGEQMNELTSPLVGADDHMDKPFEFSALEKKIHAVLQKRRAGNPSLES